MSISGWENAEIFFSFAQILVSGVGILSPTVGTTLAFQINEFGGVKFDQFWAQSKVKKKIESTCKLGET